MSSNLEYFTELKEWSERKLCLVEKYLDGATKILGSINQVFYVDGFAGKGGYGPPDEPQIPGSPLRAAQLAQKYSAENRSYSLKCINVEVDKATFDELQLLTIPYGQFVKNIHGRFTDSLDYILSQVGDKPAVFFLDPFGVDGMDWFAIQKLISRKAQTDLWLRFDAGEVRRRDGFYDSVQVGAEKNFEILSRAYGIDDKTLLHNQIQAANDGDNKQRAVEFYTERLRNEFKKVKSNGYSEFYRIGSLEKEIKYYLVFATANKKGLTLASDVVYGIEDGYKRELERHKKTLQLDMFSMMKVDPTEEEILASTVAELTKDIEVSFCGRKVSRLDIHAYLLRQRFGTIKGSHLNKALKQLIEKGIITSKTGQPSDDRTMFTLRAC